jgi:D-alanyl-D-alanine carboxypeptidase/D-alanyl-D-alanine-endopeptidase (penicillin-binding protein 4)
VAAAANPAQRALSAWTTGHPDTGALVWRLDPAGGAPVLVAGHRPELAQLPASTMKIATSAGALLTMGPAFRFTTGLYAAPSSVRDGATLRGTLYLRGSGDPVLATRAYAARYLRARGGTFASLATPLRASGVRRVVGPIVADESVFDSRRTGLGWRSYYSAYSPPLSGLSVNQNHRGQVRAAYVTDPPRAAAAHLRVALRGAGVAHRGGLRTGRTPTAAVEVAEVRSPPLSAILALMNPDSDNFVAETLRKAVGAYGGTAGTTAEGDRVTARVLAANGLSSVNDRLVDGSGLSRSNRLTAGTLVRILAAAEADPAWGRALVDSLPRGGEGTLVRRFREAGVRRRVHAKTGYINGVSSLAGVVRSPAGTRYAFAFLMNDWDITGAKATQDRVVRLLATGAVDAAPGTPVPPVTPPPAPAAATRR